MSIIDINELIPQRPPFLFIDNVVDSDQTSILVDFIFQPELDFFKGHFPGNPIVPGVILNEACFQSAAALMSLTSKEDNDETTSPSLAVVSRIQSAKFKNMVKPNDKILISTKLVEKIENAAYFKSSIKNQDGKKVSTVDFACTLVS